jgi:hypothetical protein
MRRKRISLGSWSKPEGQYIDIFIKVTDHEEAQLQCRVDGIVNIWLTELKESSGSRIIDDWTICITEVNTWDLQIAVCNQLGTKHTIALDIKNPFTLDACTTTRDWTLFHLTPYLHLEHLQQFMWNHFSWWANLKSICVSCMLLSCTNKKSRLTMIL